MAIIGVGGVVAAAGMPHPRLWIIGTDESRAGDVGVVVASVGAGIGAVSNDMFAVVVFIGVTTTLAAPLVIV